MFATYGSNLAISGQVHSAAWPRLHKASATRQAVLAPYGYNSNGVSYRLDDVGVAQALVDDKGFAMASFAHGTLWGNATAQGRIGSLRTYGIANWGFADTPMHFVCRSAGTIAALNWAKANPTLVGRIALIIPAVDPQDIHANNRAGLAASITSAWGGGPPPDASNPADNTSTFSDFDIAIWYSTDDEICTPATVEAFGQGVGAQMHSLGAVGHTSSGLVADEVASFIAG